jgi:hypothetical protein
VSHDGSFLILQVGTNNKRDSVIRRAKPEDIRIPLVVGPDQKDQESFSMRAASVTALIFAAKPLPLEISSSDK